MIAKAIHEEHSHSRRLNIAVDHSLRDHPGVSMLLPKLGCVGAHPANLDRLLYDEEFLVLLFPEGREGTRKLYRDRYRLRPFGHRELLVASAQRAGVPIVPVCVVGAEEAAPTFARLRLPRLLGGLRHLPLTATFPHLGLLGAVAYLPARFRIRFLDPVRVEAGGDRAAGQTVAEEVRARIQETLLAMVGERESVWY